MKLTILKILIITILISPLACKQNGDISKNKAQEFEEVSKEIDKLTNNSLPSGNQSNLSLLKAPVKDIKIVHNFPHDPEAYTQGLFFSNGHLYESTGLVGKSSLRKTEIETGTIIKQYNVKGGHFAEGIEIYDGKIFQLTWVSQSCFVYNSESFNLISEYHYKGEGWGLCKIEDHLVMSDGSNILKFIDPNNFNVTKTVSISNDGKPVMYLNEMEYINGEIWANIYQTDLIARINPNTGAVNSWVNLSKLNDYIKYGEQTDVLNGIAYDSGKNRIFVTGKLWKYIFEIQVME